MSASVAASSMSAAPPSPPTGAEDLVMVAAASAAASSQGVGMGKINGTVGQDGGLPAMTDILFSWDWDLDRTTTYMKVVWLPTSYKIAIAYILIVFAGQRWMKNRQPFDSGAMKMALAVWNFTFSIFSGFAAYRLLPELYNVYNTFGFQGTYCNNAEYYTDPMTGYWGWMFVMSKMPELGDTMFLILRKKPVIFLHWYHHALTFVYATLTYAEHQAWCRWALALNLSVHTVMYFYFGLQAVRIRAPLWVSKSITTIQILQFVIQCFIYCRLVTIKLTGSVPDCDVSTYVLLLGAVMYLSYLYLFGQFFYKSYIAGGKKKKPTMTTTTATGVATMNGGDKKVD